jgi:hypothetical protein
MAPEVGNRISKGQEYRYKGAVSSNIRCYHKCLGAGTAVGIATGYRLGGQSPIHCKGDTFLSTPKRPDYLCGPPMPPIQ